MPQLAPKKKCTGCLACLDACKHNAIIIKRDFGLNYIKVDSNKCINCKLCEKTCPIISPIKKNPIPGMSAYGGWCNINELRIKSASGGAFTAFAKSFFQLYNDALVVGASLNNNKVSHIIINKEESIEALMNSKYIQSNTSGIYSQIAQELKIGHHVLFSGTPCQIAGLYGYLGKKRYENLFTIEIIYHGIPGEQALQMHLQFYKSSKILSFRDKLEGQYKSQRTTIEINGKAVRIKRNNDIFYKIFTSWLLDRKSCSNCLYSTIERVADITIGDFWGGDYSQTEYEKGVSLIITNNQHGNILLRKAMYLTTKKTSIINAINTNPNLYDGFKFIQYHPVVMFPSFFKKVLPIKIWNSIIINDMPWKLLWGIYKVLTIIHNKTTKMYIIKKYNIR